MERLTYKGQNGKNYVKGEQYYNGVRTRLDEIADRLAYYEDLEEQDWLVVLPCKVVCGDTVWWADATIHEEPRKCEICFFGVYSGPDGKPQEWMNCYVYGSDGERRGFRVSSIGKTIFLTREEAEAALKEN